jgi:hypothetical protein
MHHIHISTGFMFLTAVFVIGLVGVVLAFVASVKKDRRAADVTIERAKLDAAYRAAHPVRPTADEIQQVHGERIEARQAVNGWPMPGDKFVEQRPSTAEVQHFMPRMGGYAPMATAAPVYVHDPLTGLATGMLIGSALGHSHDHTTIIHDSSPSYVDSSPSYSSSSSSSDSGFSYSSDSGSSSYDSGSSSGFDASW